MRTLTAILALGIAAGGAAPAAAQGGGNAVAQYVSVDEDAVALRGVTVIDGTGAAPARNQTILIENGRITAVGEDIDIPAYARLMDLDGHTVIPGLVGLHDHLFYSAAGGRGAQLTYSAPRLYLGSGVTTIRTTGSQSPYADINLKHAIDDGRQPGPRIFITAPYITGDESPGDMAAVTTPEEARRFVAYWAEEGADWIKAYTDIHRAELRAAIEEAHARGLKVTGHLCSVSFREAVELGIDNLEHGFLTNTDFDPQKTPDECPSNSMIRVGQVGDAMGPEADRTIRIMIENDVSMTATPAVIEPFIPDRPVTDPRTLEAMDEGVREAYLQTREQIQNAGERWPFQWSMLEASLRFEKAFHDAGGLLAAGVDPTGIGGALPGFGNQRNYELFLEVGFTPAAAVQVMTLNGARILGIADERGSVEAGKAADLVVLNGDLAADPAVIRNVVTVFKDGTGYDSAKLIADVKGRVGVN